MSNDAPTTEERGTRAGSWQLLAQLPVIVCELAPDGTTLDVSAAVEAITGYRPDEVIGRSWWGVLCPGESHRAARRACSPPAGELRDRETRVTAKDGSVRTLEWHCFGRHGETEGDTSSLCCGVDVTERTQDITSRKRAEKALRKSEERLRSLIEATSDLIWEVDEHLVYTYVSPQVRDLLGYEPEEVLGRTPFDLMPPDEARRVREAAATKEPLLAYENTNRHRDGRLVILETNARPFFDAHGTFRGYRGIDRDVTQRKQVEAARARLIAIIEATPDFVATADTAGQVLYYNRAARRMLGLGDDEDISSIRIPDTHPRWAADIVLNEGIPTAQREGLWSGETALLDRAGGEIPISQVILAHKAAGGELEVFSTIGRDITERKHLEQLREEYIQAMSHDLRSPLSAIGMQAQLLHGALGEDGSTAHVQRSLASIGRGVRRMAQMIGELAESSRLEGRLPRLERRAIVLGAFVADLLEGGGLVVQSERIRLEIPADCPPVHVDPGYLERIFSNLLGNALKYSPPDTGVRVSARRDGESVIVSVEDRGPGIPAADVPLIFERFYRAEEARRLEGLGLGLYITRKMTEAHGGRIWVDSAPGRGATFHFSLPCSPTTSG